MRSKKQIKLFQIILWIAFILYIIAVYRLTIWKSWGGFSYLSQCYASFDNWKQELLWSLNVMPFRFIFDIQGYMPMAWCKNIIGNVILFVPMGFFMLCLFPKARTWSFKKYMFTMTAVILGIELFQLFFMCGHCDIDDLILNLSGACLGFVVTKQTLTRKGI